MKRCCFLSIVASSVGRFSQGQGNFYCRQSILKTWRQNFGCKEG
ncbi:hypothetical protein M2350_001642, partial [Candidatus Fervidibacter sacchari]|nr:hypothetical protein [Candidatus Fervidibacter sacchari]